MLTVRLILITWVSEFRIFRKIVQSYEKVTAGSGKKQYKEALFKFIFGSEERKEFTLALYNALNGTKYKDSTQIKFTTLEDVMFINYHNDVACMIDQSVINLWEEQSTWNPNMALRMLTYSISMWSSYLYSTNQDMAHNRLVKIPYVNCVVLYNGKDNEPATSKISIKDNFIEECPQAVTPLDFEVMVYNINTKVGEELLSKCKPLLEYSWIISKVQENATENKKQGIAYPEYLTLSVKETLKDMPEDFVLKNVLLAKQEEVIAMLLTEFDAKRHDEIVYDDGFEQGVAQGIAQSTRESIISFHDVGVSIEMIMKALKLSREEVLKILTEQKKHD